MLDVIEGVLGILGLMLRLVSVVLELLGAVDAVIDGVAWLLRPLRASPRQEPDA